MTTCQPSLLKLAGTSDGAWEDNGGFIPYHRCENNRSQSMRKALLATRHRQGGRTACQSYLIIRARFGSLPVNFQNKDIRFDMLKSKD
jgi:hypothetical protein